MARKTVEVKALLDSLHVQLERATDAEKPAVCSAIETVLHMANVYRGYSYTFYTWEALQTHGSVDAAIAAGLGTEFDRRYQY